MQSALAGFLGSRKAVIMLLAVAATFAAVFAGKATWDQAEGLIWKIIGPWMIATAMEDSAKHKAAGQIAADHKATLDAANATPPTAQSQTVNVSAPPPG